jgi:hypothetical protein
MNEMRWGMYLSWGGERHAEGFDGEPEEKRPLERPRHRWDDNNMIHLQEVECGCMDWIVLAKDRDSFRALVNAEMNPRVP